MKIISRIMNKVKTIVGDTHCIRGICIPPNIVFGDASNPKQKARFYRDVCRVLEVGDIIITRTNWCLSNLFIPGKYKHAIVYVGPLSEDYKMIPSTNPTLNPRMCVHATSDGVIVEDLLSILNHTDKLCIFRPMSDIPLYRETIANEALKNVGKQYDFSFNWFAKDRLCCTELVDLCLSKVNIIAEQTKHPLNGKSITVADCYFHTKYLLPIFVKK